MPALLVLHLGALGDSILTWPLLAAARRALSADRVVSAGSPSRAALATCVASGEPPVPAADAALDLGDTRFTPLFGTDPAADAGLRSLFAGFDAVLSFLGPADSHAHGRLRGVFPGRVWTVDTRPAPGERRHIVEQWAAQAPELAAAGLPDLFALCEAPGPVRGVGGDYAVIHPGSGARDKCWPAERFAAVADRLAAEGIEPVFVVGEVEAERGWERSIAAGRRTLSDLTLPELAALLSRAAVFVGNDSGPAHLAAALGTPTVAVFRTTDPLVWGPRGRRAAAVGAGRPTPTLRPPGTCPWPDRPATDPEIDAVWTAVGAVTAAPQSHRPRPQR
jgi:ADP-heptose:LPS heptosyltransferase